MEQLLCPNCGAAVTSWRNPAPTADVIIYEPERGVVLVERGRPPLGHALPGGFVEVGESVENAAVREAFEETHLEVILTGLLGVYSDPARDPRRHTMSTVYIARALHPENLRAGDDAAGAAWWSLDKLPALAFDHARILGHFCEVLAGRRTTATVDEAKTRAESPAQNPKQ